MVLRGHPFKSHRWLQGEQKEIIESINTKRSSRITGLTALFCLLVVKLLILNNVYLLVWQVKINKAF